MHPPWIIVHFLFIVLSTTCKASESIKSQEIESHSNLTTNRKQREVNERERRLIPYMTYYVTQTQANHNSAQRNLLIPYTPPERKVLQLDGISKVLANNVAVNLRPQQFQIEPKQVMKLQNSQILTEALPAEGQYLQYKPNVNSVRVVNRIYTLQQPNLRPNIAPRIFLNSSPQIVRIPPTHHQQYVAPQIIQVVPYTAKLLQENRLPKSEPQIVSQKISNPFPDSHSPQEQNSYVGADSYRISEAPARVASYSPSSALIPDKAGFTVSKVFESSTIPPYTNSIHFDLDKTKSVKAAIDLARNPTTDIPPKESSPQQQLFYTQNVIRENPRGTKDFSPRPLSDQTPRLRVPLEEDIKFVATVTPISVTNELGNKQIYPAEQQSSFLSILQQTNRLPQNLTPDNIDVGIKTLAVILERLQQENKQKTKFKILSNSDSTNQKNGPLRQGSGSRKKVHSFPQPSGTSTPGVPGVDYPIYSSIPPTNFDCSTQRYKGFFGDPETKCQVWHYCDLNGGQASFLCPNGTIFSQVALTCDWWFNVKCASTSQLYVLNERLYKYILPFSPSFPEDYSGPVVDTYLAAKFKEMEAKSKSKALKSSSSSSSSSTSTTTAIPESVTEIITETSTERLDETQTVGADVY